MPNGYKITRSNYILKKRHQTLTGGVVYERDFMTTTNLGGWDSGSIPYGENNFKMYYRALSNAKKNPYRGEWLKNECNSGSPFWTMDCVPMSGTSESEQIKIKPNYNSLLDFAYYGSCTELIKSTITKIIKNFPAEMFVVDGKEYGFRTGNILKDGEYFLRNSFDFNFVDAVIPEGENELRYFLKSYINYSVLIGNASVSIKNVELIVGSTNICGDFIVRVTLEDDSINYISGKTYESGVKVVKTNFLPGTRFFPNEKNIEDFFNQLDDFSSVLLNVNTNPVYTAVLDTPRETEHGVETYQVTYTWPTENGWNLLIDSESFQHYIEGLLSVAEFYDEYYSNNLWRMLTHDSIKTMDLAFTNQEKDEDVDDYNVGTTRLEGLFLAIGRQFDEIKRSIDNVKNTSRVTYDGNNNLPDYFLSDTLGLGGWETRNIDTDLSKEDKTEKLFAGVSNGFTANDANNVFLRNLRLNSKNILSKKGTRQGIECMLNMFGMQSYDMWKMLDKNGLAKHDYDYRIEEYIGVVTDSNLATTESEETLPIENANLLKLSISLDTPEGYERDTTEGVPFAIRYLSDGNMTYKYIVPWFDKTKKYDGELYFQSKGGWGSHKTEYGGLNWEELAISSGIGYDETVKYIIVVEHESDLRNIPESRLYTGLIAYVNTVTNTAVTTHYYELVNKDNAYLIGTEGWVPVDRESGVIGRKIDYIEHIVESFIANNPHVGYGKYDMGKEYIDYLRNPLKYSIDKEQVENVQMFYDGAYDCNGNLIFTDDTFEIDSNVRDNMKCWYFAPENVNGRTDILIKGSPVLCDISYEYDNIEDYEPSIGNGEENITFESSAYTFNFISKTTGNTVNEITCDSVINTKVMKIVFIIEKKYREEFEKFLSITVFPYLLQMIPSDTIFSYEIEERNTENATIDRTTPGVNINGINAIVSDENEQSSENDFIVNFPTDRSPESYIIRLNKE